MTAPPTPAPCKITLTYTWRDDGVWVYCETHEVMLPLGFEATPERALELANEHRNEAAT